MRGKVTKWITGGKDFGFITPDQPGHEDVFLHSAELPAHESARVGLIVEFDPVDVGKPRMSAKNVKVLEAT